MEDLTIPELINCLEDVKDNKDREKAELASIFRVAQGADVEQFTKFIGLYDKEERERPAKFRGRPRRSAALVGTLRIRLNVPGVSVFSK